MQVKEEFEKQLEKKPFIETVKAQDQRGGHLFPYQRAQATDHYPITDPELNKLPIVPSQALMTQFIQLYFRDRAVKEPTATFAQLVKQASFSRSSLMRWQHGSSINLIPYLTTDFKHDHKQLHLILGMYPGKQFDLASGLVTRLPKNLLTERVVYINSAIEDGSFVFSTYRQLWLGLIRANYYPDIHVVPKLTHTESIFWQSAHASIDLSRYVFMNSCLGLVSLLGIETTKGYFFFRVKAGQAKSIDRLRERYER